MAGATKDRPVITVTLVAADRPLWSGTAVSVVIPATGGLMGILANHEPILTLVEHGVVTINEPDGAAHRFTVEEGFAAFDSNHMTIAVDSAGDES